MGKYFPFLKDTLYVSLRPLELLKSKFICENKKSLSWMMPFSYIPVIITQIAGWIVVIGAIIAVIFKAVKGDSYKTKKKS